MISITSHKENKSVSVYKKWMKKICIFLFWILVWEGLALAVANAIVLAGPRQVLLYLLENGTKKDLWFSIGASFARILAGFFLAYFGGIVIGIVNYRVQFLRELTEPVLASIKAIPVAAVTVLLLLWFSSQSLSIVLCFIIVLPNVYEQMMAGLRNVDEEQLAMANLYGITWWEKLVTIYRMSVVPYLYSSMKICVGLSFKSAVAAEIIATPVGTMGERLYFAKIHLDTPGIFAWTLIIVALSVFSEKILLYGFEFWFVKPMYVGLPKVGMNEKVNKKHSGDSLNESMKHVNVVEEITLDNLTKSYGKNRVIQQMTSSMKAGECHVIMGVSGSGKTTLLNMINGMIQPDEGRISIKCAQESKPGEQKITYGMVFQNEVVLDDYDVIKNIEIFAGHSLTREELDDLEILLPKNCLTQKSSALSGGMKRRLQIARALFSPVSMLIMDEPFRGLDEENRKKCIGMIKKYQRNRILVITSHDARDVEDLGGYKWELELH